MVLFALQHENAGTKLSVFDKCAIFDGLRTDPHAGCFIDPVIPAASLSVRVLANGPLETNHRSPTLCRCTGNCLGPMTGTQCQSYVTGRRSSAAWGGAAAPDSFTRCCCFFATLMDIILAYFGVVLQLLMMTCQRTRERKLRDV